MTKQYNVVLVGCGHMGAAHMDDIYYREDINIEGVVDLDPEKAKLFVRKYGATDFNLINNRSLPSSISGR